MSEKKSQKENIILLHKGDIIRLEKGMKIFAKIPEKFNTSYQNKSATGFHSITIGNDLSDGATAKDFSLIKSQIIELLKHYNVPANLTLIHNFLGELQKASLLSKKTLDTSFFIGEYQVYYANFEKGNVDTNGGYCVYCKKMDDPTITIYFHQTGTSDALISDIKPIHSNKK